MIRKFRNIVLCAIFVIITSGISFAATVKSDDANKPMSNNAGAFDSVDLVGVDKHVIGGTTTGQIAKNNSVSTLMSTTTNNSCLLYGIIISSNSSTAYTAGTDYIVLRDTSVVNTTTSADFVVMMSTANLIAGAKCGTFVWTPPAPIKFDYGICATNSSSNWTSTILFRYLKR